MLITVGRYIETKHWGILYVEHCGKIYLHKILRNTVRWTLGRFIYTKYWGILYVAPCGKIYLHKILGNTLCSALWEYLFTYNTGDYFTLSIVGKIIYTTYWGLLYAEHRRFIYTKYWGILYVEHCGKIYLHTIQKNILCWTLREDLFAHNTEE
jgi:hypothetical protein